MQLLAAIIESKNLLLENNAIQVSGANTFGFTHSKIATPFYMKKKSRDFTIPALVNS